MMEDGLVLVTSTEHWAAMHALRRLVLFAPGRHAMPVAYDEQHPDDREPGSSPYLWIEAGKALATARFDRRGSDEGVVRLVCVSPEAQGRGVGRRLMNALHDLARSENRRRLLVNAAPDAVGFYCSLGWVPLAWDPSELTGISANSVQMGLVLDA